MFTALPRGRLPVRAWVGGLALCIVLLPAAGCSGESRAERGQGLTRERFIELIVELREAERSVAGEDSALALFAVRKAEILERHGTSEAEVRTFVEASARDLRTLSSTWEEIADRLRQPPTEDSSEAF